MDKKSPLGYNKILLEKRPWANSHGEGNLCCGRRRCCELKRSNQGDTRLEDQKRSGRPHTVDSKAIRQAVEDSPQTSTCRLSNEVECSQSTVQRKLVELSKINRRFRVVPHELTHQQAQRRVDVCQQLLAEGLDGRTIRLIVTCEEKWIFFRSSDLINQWLNPRDHPESVIKQGSFEHKSMLCVW